MLKAIYLEWVDSQSFRGWSEERELSDPTPNKSIGWYVRETDEWIFISSSADLDNKEWIDPVAIPKSAITKRLFVETFP